MARNLLPIFQKELNSLPESELNDSTKNRVLEILTKAMPKVEEQHQTSKTVDLPRMVSPPLPLNIGASTVGMLPRAGLLFHGDSMDNEQVSGMFAAMPSPMPWEENMEICMPSYGTDFSSSSRMY